MVLYDNRYEEIKNLGSGTYGQVSLAKDLKTGTDCAIKILLPLFFDTQQTLTLETFKSEFHTLKNLNHPYIAKVLDTGFDKGKEYHYIVFEYIKGKDLFDGTKDQSIEVIERLFVQALRALNYLHSQNIHHFDIKPKNFLVVQDQNGQLNLKVIDFGLANFFQQEFVKEICNVEEDGKRPGIGSPPFIAPEIIKGEHADHRADLYSLGCSFYKAFTRKLPFTGNEKEEFYYKHLNEEPKSPRFHNPDIPEYLDEILLNLLKKNPSERYESAEKVIKELYLLSATDVEVEPIETRSSYLPEKGKLIGRRDEWRKFKKIFSDRLYLQKNSLNPPYLIITGEKGTGKTRFLEECKNESRKELIPIISWEEVYEGDSKDKLQAPCLVVGDDVFIDSSKLDYIELNFESSSVLTILTTSQKKEDIPCDPNHVIELKNFDHIEPCPLPGQKGAWQKFERMFEECVYGRDLKPSPFYLVVRGQKSQTDLFLEECKKRSERYFIPVMSLEKILSYPSYKKPTPCLVLENNIIVDSSKTDEITNHFKNEEVLVIFSTSQKKEDIPCDPERIIELQKSDSKEIKKLQQENEFKETKEFLLKATGLEIPEEDVKIIHQITQGNPLYLTEYLRGQFEKGTYRDEQGQWDPRALEDLREDPTLGATQFIEKQLSKKIDHLQLDEGKLFILNMMALFDQPTLGDLTEMTNAHLIDETLSWLMDKEILKVDDSQHYIFTNPLYKKIFIERMDPEYKAELCDQIADFLESQKEDQEKILYYKGRGKSEIADVSLLQLAQIKKEQCLYSQAKENLEIIIQRYPKIGTTQGPDIFYSALLELGEICYAIGEYENSKNFLFQLVGYYKENNNLQKDLIYIKGLEQLGVIFHRIEQFTTATEYFYKGLEELKNKPELLWLKITLKNRLARNLYDEGNISEAENIFNQNWKIWEGKLNKEEKLLAIRNDIDLIYESKGEHEKSVYYLEEYFDVLKSKPYLEVYPIIIYKLARAYRALEKIDKSKEMLAQCVEILRSRKGVHWLYAVYNEFGLLEEDQKNYQKAIEYFKYSLDLAFKTTSDLYLYLIATNMARVYFELQNYDESEKYYNFFIQSVKSKKVEPGLNIERSLFAALLGRAANCRQKKEFDKAKSFLAEAFELFQSKQHLKIREQFYWEEKAILDYVCGNQQEAKEALNKLSQLQKEPYFSLKLYQEWLQKYPELIALNAITLNAHSLSF